MGGGGAAGKHVDKTCSKLFTKQSAPPMLAPDFVDKNVLHLYYGMRELIPDVDEETDVNPFCGQNRQTADQRSAQPHQYLHAVSTGSKAPRGPDKQANNILKAYPTAKGPWLQELMRFLEIGLPKQHWRHHTHEE